MPNSLVRRRPACLAALAAVLLAALGAGPAGAQQNAMPASAGLLAGRTLSAVIYVRRPPSMPGYSELARFMFQAYLSAEGGAFVRVWDTAADAYTRPQWRRWSMAGSRFCVGLPAPAPPRICADLHVWGPRIAGIGVKPYAMLDGDIEPGNTLVATR